MLFRSITCKADVEKIGLPDPEGELQYVMNAVRQIRKDLKGPLIFYSIAIRITNLSTVGLMQYIEPSLQFVLAVMFFGELFDEVKAVTFAFIWVGLLFTIFESIVKGHKRKKLANHPL